MNCSSFLFAGKAIGKKRPIYHEVVTAIYADYLYRFTSNQQLVGAEFLHFDRGGTMNFRWLEGAMASGAS